jgi:hypothetical protein
MYQTALVFVIFFMLFYASGYNNAITKMILGIHFHLALRLESTKFRIIFFYFFLRESSSGV